METSDKISNVYDDFFGNIVENAVKNVKQTVRSATKIEFIVEWAIPIDRK